MEIVKGIKRFTSEEKQAIIKAYQNGDTSPKIASKYNCGVSMVTKCLRDNGIGIRGSRVFTDEQEAEIGEIYLAGKSTRQIAKERGVDKICIIAALRRQGIQQRDPSERNRLYKLNPNVFDVITPEAAYWWGFLYADGSLSKEKTLILHLSQRDETHLEKFRRFMQSESPVKFISMKVKSTGKEYPSCCIEFTDKSLGKRLIDLGIGTGRKLETSDNFRRVIDNLPTECYSHFIRGLFDGDGSVVFNPVGIKFCGNTMMLDWMKNILAEKVYVNKNRKLYLHKSGLKYLNYSGRPQTLRILDFIYLDADPGIYLERKHERYMQIPRGQAIQIRDQLGRFVNTEYLI